jgi:hypothetical protein
MLAPKVIAATLSGGPVGPGDRVNATDRTLTMRSCTAAGRVLRPERPLALLDAAVTGGSSQTLWSAFTTVQPTSATTRDAHHVVFYAGQKTVELRPRDLLGVCSDGAIGAKRCSVPSPVASSYLATVVTETGGLWPAAGTTAQLVTDASPLRLQPPAAPSGSKGVVPFVHVALAPVGEDTAMGATPFVVLGELDKVVPVSSARFGALTVSADGTFKWDLMGAPGEIVSVWYAKAGEEKPALMSAKCTMTAVGVCTLQCDDTACSCPNNA